MRRCTSLAPSALEQLGAASLTALQPLLSPAVTTAAGAGCETGSSPEHAARLESSKRCSTSSSISVNLHTWSCGQSRGFAKAAGGKGGSKAAPAKAAAAAADDKDDLSPPEFKIKRVPRVYKGDPVAQLTGPQKALLEELAPGSGPLRSLRQLNWALGPSDVLALWHHQVSDVVGSNVQMVPFMLDDMFQSAACLAAFVKETVVGGAGMPRVEQAMLTRIANTAPSDLPFEGVKIELKGRMSGKGGKASKKVWVWGRTGKNAADDPLDFAHEAVVTRAGYIGIKVWVKYKRSHMVPQSTRIPQPAITLPQLMSLPLPAALPSRSSSAWWNAPVTGQPWQHKAWEAFQADYDPLTGARQQQQLEQSTQDATAAAGVQDSGSANGR